MIALANSLFAQKQRLEKVKKKTVCKSVYQISFYDPSDDSMSDLNQLQQ